MIRLRGHHLVCIHFIRGGFTDEFRRKVDEITSRCRGGEEVEVIDGADDLCTSCPYLRDGRCVITETAEDEVREMDSTALSMLGLKVSDVVRCSELREKVVKVVREWWSRYCVECELRSSCEPEIKRYL